MAKKTYRKRYYRRKGRWSANIATIPPTSITAASNSNFYSTLTLCENPAQNNSTVSQQFTVKNVELNYQIEGSVNSNGAYVENIICYIMYVPQGMTVEDNYPNNHPEYIMAYRYLGSPDVERPGTAETPFNTPGRLPPKIKTRLARRLQTGDSIIFLIAGVNNTATDANLEVNGLVRWWTKAN